MNLEINTSEAIKIAEEKTVILADNSRIIVNSQPTFEKAKSQLIEVKTIKKLVKEKKESITKPLNEALKNARALFKPVEENILKIETYLNSSVLKYNQKLLAEQKVREDEAAKKMEEANKNNEEINLDKITRKVENTAEKLNMIRTRKVKKFKIVDETKIPRNFLTPDEVKIRQAMMNDIKVEGVEYYVEETAVNSY